MTSVLCCKQLGYGVRLAERFCRDKDALIAEVHGQTYVATIRKEIGPARRWAYSCEARRCLSAGLRCGGPACRIRGQNRVLWQARGVRHYAGAQGRCSAPGISERQTLRSKNRPANAACTCCKVLAAMTEVATTIRPRAIKPMEVSFIVLLILFSYREGAERGSRERPKVSALLGVIQPHLAVARRVLTPSPAHLHEQEQMHRRVDHLTDLFSRGH